MRLRVFVAPYRGFPRVKKTKDLCIKGAEPYSRTRISTSATSIICSGLHPNWRTAGSGIWLDSRWTMRGASMKLILERPTTISARFRNRKKKLTEALAVLHVSQPAYSRRVGYTGEHEARQPGESRKLSPDEDAIRTVTGGRPRQGWHCATRVRGSDGKPLAAARGAQLRLTAKHFLLDAL